MADGRKIIYPPGGPKPGGPYSPGVIEGEWLFVAGQVGRDPATGQLASGVEAQVRQALENVGGILRAAGCDFKDVTRVGVYLTRAEDFAALNEVYRQYFGEPFPARTTIICALVDQAMLVEIDAIARVATG
jgi:2-iminobutanoate/2-iminopropanoate deaminase